MAIRVLIADDQEIVRVGLAMLLDAQPDIEVVGQAADGLHAVALARELRPDVCLFDIRMPHLDGIEATRQLAGPGVHDPLAVVVITTFDDDEYVHGALKAGAHGFLLKFQLRQRYLERGTARQNHAALYEILKLTNVSRPVVTHQRRHRFFGNAFDLLLHLLRKTVRKEVHQQRNVFRTLA